MISTFKILNDIYDNKCSNFPSKKKLFIQEENNLKFAMQQTSLSILKSFISIRNTNIWIYLTCDIISVLNDMH